MWLKQLKATSNWACTEVIVALIRLVASLIRHCRLEESDLSEFLWLRIASVLSYPEFQGNFFTTWHFDKNRLKLAFLRPRWLSSNPLFTASFHFSLEWSVFHRRLRTVRFQPCTEMDYANLSHCVKPVYLAAGRSAPANAEASNSCSKIAEPTNERTLLGSGALLACANALFRRWLPFLQRYAFVFSCSVGVLIAITFVEQWQNFVSQGQKFEFRIQKLHDWEGQNLALNVSVKAERRAQS